MQIDAQAVREQLQGQMALQELRQRRWERLFLAAIDMSETELRAALKHRSSERRFAAAYVVGERLLDWQEDLISLLKDKSEGVRQAARRSLVILSFLALNPEEAQQLRSPSRKKPALPLSQLKKAADFGPPLGANPAGRTRAANQWKEWWADHQPRKLVSTEKRTLDSKEEEGNRLAKVLLQSSPERRLEIAKQYRDSKGVPYTEALALAIVEESGQMRWTLRKLLSERMARMTDKTLGRYLDDENTEIRRAAALGLAMKQSKSHLDGLINLLLDPQPLVARAAHAALHSLCGKDFGPHVNATEEEKTEAVKRWQQWRQQERQ